MVIEDLHDMHVPPWLLLILTSYLTERSMVMCYKGATSSPRSLPGSSPQGAFLGIFFFIIKFNGASLRPKIHREIDNSLCRFKRQKCKTDACAKHAVDMHALYIDDLSEAVAVDLKKQLIEDPVKRPYPLNYHERTKHILPIESNLLQKQLLKVEKFTLDNKMKINERKSNILIFNKSRKYDFPPELSFTNNQILDVLEETKLLGIVLTPDLRWQANTLSICTKAMSKMWLLRRMKVMGLQPNIIFDYYLKEVRVLAEQAVPIWNSGLTKAQISDIEKIQKVALKVILGDQFKTYDKACEFFDVDKLSVRRLELSTNFALKLFKSDRSAEFFTLTTKTVNTRGDHPLLVEDISRTTRCYYAPHNYLTRLINQNEDKLKK